MRNCLIGLVLLAAVTPALPAAGPPQNAPGANGIPDLSGIWAMIDQVGPGGFIVTEEPSMLPWAQRVYERFRQGTETATERTLDDGDPILMPYCMPHGFPRVFSHTPPFEIVQVPSGKVIYVLFESNNQSMRIYLDGRDHPEGTPPTFFGHSIGRWMGDTLLVETVRLEGLGGYSRIDALGHPHTDALRVEQRIRRTGQDLLEINFLFDDPKTYTKPWTGKRVYRLQSGWELMDYNICQAEQKERYLEYMGGPKQGQ